MGVTIKAVLVFVKVSFKAVGGSVTRAGCFSKEITIYNCDDRDINDMLLGA
jgi:hypothetical protein